VSATCIVKFCSVHQLIERGLSVFGSKFQRKESESRKERQDGEES